MILQPMSDLHSDFTGFTEYPAALSGVAVMASDPLDYPDERFGFDSLLTIEV